MASEPCVMFQGLVKDSAAFRLMQKMGWEEGLGLGKDLQGMKSHIRVAKKSDTSGIGLDAKAKAQANWTLNTQAYDSILKNLKVQVSETVNKGDEDESTSEEDEDDVKRDENAAEVVELNPRKVSRPQGRYKRREQGKMVGSYSSVDLAAILGTVSGKTETIEPLTSEKVPAKEEVLKKLKKTTGKDVYSSSKENKSVESEDVPPPPLPAHWWGLKYGFVRAGHLGAARDPVNLRTGDENATASSKDPSVRTAFREQDQENLYNLVHEMATTGKKGLGRGNQPKKIGGAHFKGQKKVFDSSSEDEEEEEEEEIEVTPSIDEGKGKPKHTSASDAVRGASDAQETAEETKPSKRRKTGEEGNGESERVDTSGETHSQEKSENTSNWRKLVKQLLSEAPSQTLSFKRLQKRVLAAGLFAEEEQCFKLKLEKSSRFVLEGKTVSLATKVGA